jgi:clan AA aspartic protease
MIIGRVTDALDIVAPRGVVIGPDNVIELEAIVDTGFNGTTAISKSFAEQLSLKPVGSNEVALADGRIETLEFCELTVEWAGLRREVAAWIVDQGCLVGMELLLGFRLEIDVIPDGEVTLHER